MNELRLALRSLRRAPVFSVTSILTLALGISLVTAAFSLIDGVLIRPLPFAAADRVMVLAQEDGQGRATGVSYPNFLDWRTSAAAGRHYWCAGSGARCWGAPLRRGSSPCCNPG
jgi:hypothetical protein